MKDMTINELMLHYLEGCKIAKVSNPMKGIPGGNAGSVYPEMKGGNFRKKIEGVMVWGTLDESESVFLLKTSTSYYVFSLKTFNEIKELLKSDLSNCEVLEGKSSSGFPGGMVYVTPQMQNQNTITATAWCQIYPGALVKVFTVKDKQYAIPVSPSKVIKSSYHELSRSGNMPNPEEEIIWKDLLEVINS